MRSPIIVTDEDLWRLAGALAGLIVGVVAVAFTLGGLVVLLAFL